MESIERTIEELSRIFILGKLSLHRIETKAGGFQYQYCTASKAHRVCIAGRHALQPGTPGSRLQPCASHGSNP